MDVELTVNATEIHGHCERRQTCCLGADCLGLAPVPRSGAVRRASLCEAVLGRKVLPGWAPLVYRA